PDHSFNLGIGFQCMDHRLSDLYLFNGKAFGETKNLFQEFLLIGLLQDWLRRCGDRLYSLLEPGPPSVKYFYKVRIPKSAVINRFLKLAKIIFCKLHSLKE